LSKNGCNVVLSSIVTGLKGIFFIKKTQKSLRNYANKNKY
jgi:hypothetical protein